MTIDPTKLEQLLRRLNLPNPSPGEQPTAKTYGEGAEIPPLKRDGERSSDIPYQRFMDSLDGVFKLHSMSPRQMKWIDVVPSSIAVSSPPEVIINPAKNFPQLSIALHPHVDEKDVTGFRTYQAPLMVRDIQRFGTAKETLKKYKLSGWRGAPAERAEKFDEAISLGKVLEHSEDLVKDDTPIVEVIALLPFGANNDYTLEFVPQIRFGRNDWDCYEVSTFIQDQVSSVTRLTEGSSIREIKDGRFITENNAERVKDAKWQADMVPELSDVEQLLLPSQNGHMFLLAKPIESKDPYKKILSTPITYVESYEPMRSFGPAKSMSPTISETSISRGREDAGSGGLFEGELKPSSNGNTVLYHIRFIGVKPGETKLLGVEELTKIGKSLDSFSSN